MRECVLITGGTGGLGKALCRSFAKEGYRVIFTARHDGKAIQLQNELGEDSLFYLVDLLDLKQVSELADHLKADGIRVDILINNAGALYEKRQLFDEMESNMIIHHLTPTLLTRKLHKLKVLKPRARVLNINSDAHRGKFDPEDIGNLNGRYRFMNAYGHAKATNLIYSQSIKKLFAKRDITINHIHPGVIRTGIFKSSGKKWLAQIMKIFGPLFADKPELAARRIKKVVESGLLAKNSGKYFSKMQLTDRHVSTTKISWRNSVVKYTDAALSEYL